MTRMGKQVTWRDQKENLAKNMETNRKIKKLSNKHNGAVRTARPATSGAQHQIYPPQQLGSINNTFFSVSWFRKKDLRESRHDEHQQCQPLNRFWMTGQGHPVAQCLLMPEESSQNELVGSSFAPHPFVMCANRKPTPPPCSSTWTMHNQGMSENFC